jgi:hypothetical protein
MRKFDHEEVLVFRPVTGVVDVAAVDAYVAAIPGSFRDPHGRVSWVLPAAIVSHKTRERFAVDPHAYSYDACITVKSDYIAVLPNEAGAGRARKFVTWLVGQAEYELEVREERIGIVRSPDDIYGEVEWDDPDDSPDPTTNPPLTGVLLTFYRRLPDARWEFVEVHSSGVMSYEQHSVGEDIDKTYRRLAPEALALITTVINEFPREQDDSEIPNDGVEVITLRVDTPTGDFDLRDYDLTHLPDFDREPLQLLESWAQALRADRGAMPEGLLPYEPGSARTAPR